MDNDPVAQNNPYQAPEAAVADIASPGEPVLAERIARLGASFVDGTIQVILFVIICIPLFIFIGVAPGFGELTEFTGWIEKMGFLASVLSMFLGFAIYSAVNFHLLRKNGQTVGKYLFGIKIVRSDGSPVDVGRVLLYRYLSISAIGLIPAIGGIVGLVNLLLIFRDSRKCLHDEIADTIVIRA